MKGKKLTVAGQGATPEYMIRYLAAKEGISLEGGAEGIELDFSIPNAEIQLSEDSLKISLEDLVETEYKIQTELKGTPSENSFVYDIVLDTDTLSIKGAKSLIETIDKVREIY